MRTSRWQAILSSMRSDGVASSFVGAVVMSIAAVFLLAASAPAQTRTWDQGNGDWDTTSTNWTGATWVDGNTAIFGGTAGSTISLTAPISATGVTFNVNNDVVTGNTLTLTGTPVVTVGSGLTATVNSVLAGTVGMSVEGGGTVNFGGDNSLRSANSTTGLLVGSTSANNTVNIANGGKFNGAITTAQFRSLTIGGSTFGGNVVNISTPGTDAAASFLVSGNSGQINMGVSSSNNQLNITNGAYVKSQSGGGTGTWTIGTNAGANGNSISVSGTSSVLRNATSSFLHIGAAGNSNTLTVQNGGTYSSSARLPQMGFNGGDNNSVTITGSNSLAIVASGSSNGWFQIGSDTASVGATGNNFDVLAGGKMNFTGTGTSRTFSIGQTAGSDTSRLRISGTGSSANVNFGLPISVGIRATGTTATVGGNSNSLEVYDGGSLTTVTPIYVGSSVAIGGTESTGNSVSIGNGTSNIASITVNADAAAFNAAAGYDGVYTVPGTTTPVAVQTSSYSVPGTGSLTAQGIFLNGTTSVLNFNNGRLIAGASSTGTLVSGSGTVNLNGPAYVSTALANSIISSLISGTGSFTKEGTGLLTLSNASNAYLGNTTVSGGTLSLAAAFLADAATVTLASGSVLDLNYLATDTIGNLVLGGATQAAGTYGAIGSGAGVETAYLTGTGILNVAAVVPEPETMVLLGAGLAAVGFLRRRRHA
jgi:fibronectin-binding autotransporter adhesin